MKLKFRLWDDDNKLYSVVDFEDLDKTIGTLDSFRDYFSSYYLANDNLVLQFTGKVDKNKKEIFAGDYVLNSGDLYRIDACEGGYECNKLKEFRDGTFLEKGCYTFSVLCHNCEVVGNIWETPKQIY